MLVYYFNEEGTVIQSDQDFAIQIPLGAPSGGAPTSSACAPPTPVPRPCGGALHSGFFTHLVARAELVRTLLEK